MANYSAIKAAVNAYIKANGKKEITGRILNSVLNATIDSLGKEFQFGGVLTPADDPGQPDQNVAYIGAAGTYSNFDNLVIESGNIGIFLWNGDWSFETIPVGKDYDNDIQSLTNGLQELSENIQELSDNVIHLDGINEEDLSIPEGGKLQFANRVYNAQQPNGMGYVILRKDKTFAEQVTLANTIYEIRYNFDLGGASVTIPAGCVLKFNGGNVNNGLIAFNNTFLVDTKKGSFYSCIFSGTIANDFLDVSHLANMTTLADCAQVFQSILDICDVGRRVKVYIPAGKYTLGTTLVLPSNLELYGDGENTILYNSVSSGIKKIVLISSYTHGKYDGEDFPHYEISGYAEDDGSVGGLKNYSKIIVDQSGASDYIVGTFFVMINSISSHTYPTYLAGKIIGVENNGEQIILTLDFPLPILESEITNWTISPNIEHYDKGASEFGRVFIHENNYVHDLFIWQADYTSSGWYAVWGGYNCRYERLKIQSSTPYGCNFSVRCSFIDINATGTGGLWDSAEVSYKNYFENISVVRVGNQNVNVIGFNVTQGYLNVFRNIYIDFNYLNSNFLSESTKDSFVDGLTLKRVKFEYLPIAHFLIHIGEGSKWTCYRNVLIDGLKLISSITRSVYQGLYYGSGNAFISGLVFKNVDYSEFAVAQNNDFVFVSPNVHIENVEGLPTWNNSYNEPSAEKLIFKSTRSNTNVAINNSRLGAFIGANRELSYLIHIHGNLYCSETVSSENWNGLEFLIFTSQTLITGLSLPSYNKRQGILDVVIGLENGTIYTSCNLNLSDKRIIVRKKWALPAMTGTGFILRLRGSSDGAGTNPNRLFSNVTSEVYIVGSIKDLATITDETIVQNTSLSGTTASRPTRELSVGDSYFDSTLGKPIWYKGSSVWVDATGATV